MSEIPVFFTDRMVAPDQGASPSAHKPAAVVADWIEQGFPISLRVPEACTREDLALAHERTYVDAVLDLQQRNGFGNRSAAVAAALPYTSGAMLSAARAALDNGKVAVAPVSGFHHACHSMGGGFCTFNGLMVTALVLQREGRVGRVGILDFDQHYGNGTDDIIDTLQIDWVVHYTAGAEWRSPSQAEAFLARIDDIVATMRSCDLVLYQAGADPHINDPLGGWLTTSQLMERDRLFFEALARRAIPIAWNLAGGYQRTDDGGIEPVLAIHRNTMQSCLQRYMTESSCREGSSTRRIKRTKSEPMVYFGATRNFARRLGACLSQDNGTESMVGNISSQRCTLFFTNGVAHAEETAARLNFAGIGAAAIWGRTPTAARRYYLETCREISTISVLGASKPVVRTL